MAPSIAKLFLVSVLCAIYVKVEAATITIVDIKTDIPGNDVIEDFTTDLSDNLINGVIKVKKNCPGPVEAEIKMYQGDNLVKQIAKKLDQPIKEIDGFNLCETVDGPDIDDDCSVGEGEQVFQNCDITKLLSDTTPGDYKIVADIKQDDLLSTLTINVNVEA